MSFPTLKHRKNTVIVPVLLLVLSRCVITSGPAEETFNITLLKTSDTLSPYSPLKLILSESIEDSSNIHIEFNPPHSHFYSIINVSKDTLTIIPTAPFQGNTKYQIHPKIQPFSIDQISYRSIADTLSFCTYPLEKEPNNSKSIADTLYRRTFGTLSTVTDTDYFVHSNTAARSFYLKSFNSQSTFIIHDIKGNFLQQKNYKSSDTIAFPVSFSFPVHIKIFPFHLSSDGNYETGYIEK